MQHLKVNSDSCKVLERRQKRSESKKPVEVGLEGLKVHNYFEILLIKTSKKQSVTLFRRNLCFDPLEEEILIFSSILFCKI